jgi:hypothetical protein
MPISPALVPYRRDHDPTSGDPAPAVSDVVLIHSTGQGAAGWERVVHALTERGHTAHTVELPSDPDLLAADFAELIREGTMPRTGFGGGRWLDALVMGRLRDP